MIAVVGSGSWGSALAATLARKSQTKVFLWGREPEVLEEISKHHTNTKFLPGISLPLNIEICADLKTVLDVAQDIVIAVPSRAFCEVLAAMKPHLTSKHRIIWATKGLEPKNGRFLHQVVIEELGLEQIYAVLAGPSFAKEVARQLPTAVTIATNDENFGQDLLTYFHADNFRVYLSTDVIGAQVGGVMKNILAVAAGLSDGLGFGANARAALITRGLAEMMRFGTALGAKVETLQGLAGVGDVILTCTDDQSRNRRFGLALAVGKPIDEAQAEIGQIVEAVDNAAEVCRLAAAHELEMPIASQVYKILTKDVSPQQAVRNLISRKPSYEWTEPGSNI
jgi:glycerol-3-phosphate dehydrogenase (NAD(P)+)